MFTILPISVHFTFSNCDFTLSHWFSTENSNNAGDDDGVVFVNICSKVSSVYIIIITLSQQV